MLRSFFLLLLWLAATRPAPGAGVLQPFTTADELSLCTEQLQPVFVYQNFWTETEDPVARVHELWVDRDKEVIRGFWLVKGEGPYFLIGARLSKQDFYACLYRSGQKKALGFMLGSADATFLRFRNFGSKDGEALTLRSTIPLPEQRSYSLRYQTQKIDQQIKDRVPKDGAFTCETSVTGFELIAEPRYAQKKRLQFANRKLGELVGFFSLEDQTKKCLDMPKEPQVEALSVYRMYSSDAYLSAKMDYYFLTGMVEGLAGIGLTLNLTQRTVVTWKDILTKAEQSTLLSEVRRRFTVIHGKADRLKDLATTSFSFNTQTMVVSFQPADQAGYYADLPYVDIPIPLDYLFGVLRLSRKGPFAP